MPFLAERSYEHHAQRMRTVGLRPTRQRLALSELLWQGCDRHVTAEMLHAESFRQGIEVSLATVYNTLHQFTEAGLLRGVSLGGGCCFFDTNTLPHHHFLNEDTGTLMDIPAEVMEIQGLPSLPKGTRMSSVDIIIRVRGGA